MTICVYATKLQVNSQSVLAAMNERKQYTHLSKLSAFGLAVDSKAVSSSRWIFNFSLNSKLVKLVKLFISLKWLEAH